MEEIKCTFYKKVHEDFIVRFRAISEIPPKAIWREDIFTAIGNDLPMKKDRETILYGKWESNEYKGRSSLQFRVERYRVLLPTDRNAIENVLANEIPGIGKKIAKTIVEAYGEDTFKVLQEGPPMNNEIPKSKSIAVREYIKAEKRKERLFSLMSFYSISKRQAKKALSRFGEKTESILENNIYFLYQSGVSLEAIDKINSSVPVDDKVRIRAAIVTTLQHAAKDGHIFLHEDELIHRTQKRLKWKVKNTNILFGLEFFKKPFNEDVTYQDNKYYLSNLYEAEMIIATMVKQRMHGKILTELEAEELEKDIDILAKQENVILAQKQKQAVYMSQIQRLLLVTGGPGTGKTTAINLIIKMLQKKNRSILLMAPTGCATKRMIQATSFKNGGTIHSRIGYFNDDEFIASKRIEEDIVIIDECSMIPCDLFRDIFTQIRPDATLILVGDKDQLDPIGPGRVFADLIESKTVPTVVLDHIFRQGKNSMIPVNAKNINAGMGKMIWNNSDFQLIRMEDGEEENIQKLLCKKYQELLTEYSPKDIQVLSPLKKKKRNGKVFTTSTEYLNQPLEKLANPFSGCEDKICCGAITFYKSDKIMETSNSNIPGIMNGDIGEIVSVDHKKKEINCKFDDSQEIYKKGNLKSLELAYAITIHKSQGNEYPVVIIPLMKSYYRMLTRKLLYTAVTRASEKVIFVGSLSAFYMAVRDDFTEKRYTSLKERLLDKDEKGKEQTNEIQQYQQLEFSITN